MALSTLSTVELEIAAMIGLGMSDKQIATALGTTADSVGAVVEQITIKLGVQNRTCVADAFKSALRAHAGSVGHSGW